MNLERDRGKDMVQIWPTHATGIILILIVLSLFISSVSAAGTPENTLVSISPPTQLVSVGNNFTVETAKPPISLRYRQEVNFNSGWQFRLEDPEDSPSYNNEWGPEDPSYGKSWENVSVPHTHMVYPRPPIMECWAWENGGHIWNRTRYVGWYKKQFYIPSDWSSKKIFIYFEGVMEVAEVWVNGNYVGRHAISGYDPFSFDITNYVNFGESNVILVMDNNKPNPNIPPDGVEFSSQFWGGILGAERDYTLWGGIYRDVYLTAVDKMYITYPWVAENAGVRITTPSVSSDQATVKAEINVKNEYGSTEKCTVITTIIDPELNEVGHMESQAYIRSGENYTFSQSCTVSNPLLWEPSNPYLYWAHVQVMRGDTPVDDYVVRFGIRYYEFNSETGFWLNGKQIKLIGANRHQDYLYVGNAVPNRYHYFDAKLMKDAGMNFFRGSHYPHDPAFLDACDELGIMVIEEPPTWHFVPNKAWWENCKEAFRRMIRRDRNHPSIILWNPTVNHQGCNSELISIARAEDPTRPLKCGLTWGEWADPSLTCYLGLERNAGVAYRDDEHAIREQANSWLYSIDRAKGDDSTAGFAAWVMFDYQSMICDWHPGEGMADLDRIPKFAYYAYKAELTDEPMVYIADYWNGLEGDPLTVYSNCDEVRIIVNGKVVATHSPDSEWKHLDHPPFTFPEVTYEPGTITAEGLIGGEVVATDTRRTPGPPSAVRLEADYTELPANGYDFTRIVVSLVDDNGTVVPTEGAVVPSYGGPPAPYITFDVSGVGRLIGGTDPTWPDNHLRVLAGQNIVLVQSPPTPGSMTLTAHSPGLTSDSIVINFTPVPPSPLSPSPSAPSGLTASAVSSSQINLDWDDNPENNLSHYNIYRADPAQLVLDSSRGANHGVLGLTEDPELSDPEWVCDERGGYALEFDSAENDRVSVPGSENGPLDVTGSELSLSAWVYPRDWGEKKMSTIVSKGMYQYGLWYNGLEKEYPFEPFLNFFIVEEDGGYWNVTCRVDASYNNSWHHLVGTYNGLELKLYLDGVQVGTSNLSWMESIGHQDDPVSIGWNAGAAETLGDPWCADARIDDIRIYERVLSGAEVENMYNGDPVSDDNLVGWWKFDLPRAPFALLDSSTSSSYSDNGLTENTTYYYKVTAVDSSGNESDPSAEVSAKTLPSTPMLVVESLAISPDEVEPGEEVTISVEVKNAGEVARTHTLELLVNGEIVSSEPVTLEPGENRIVLFTISEDEPGSYEVSVGGLTGGFEVVKPEEPEEGGLPLLPVITGIVVVIAVIGGLIYWRRR